MLVSNRHISGHLNPSLHLSLPLKAYNHSIQVLRIKKKKKRKKSDRVEDHKVSEIPTLTRIGSRNIQNYENIIKKI